MRKTLLPVVCGLLFTLGCSRQKDQNSVQVEATPTQVSAPGVNAPGSAESSKPGSQPANAKMIQETAEICRRAQDKQRPVLVEFSADWCQDCQVLAKLKAEPKLKAELEHFEELKIDVDDERYEDLRLAFEVRSIARWVLLTPGDCSTPLVDWQKIADRVLEPTQNEDIDSETLTTWLSRHRSTG